MDPLQNPAFLLFAAIAPLLIALIKQKGFTQQVNAMIALACYVIVGILGAVVSGTPLDLMHVTDLIVVTTLVGTAAYNLIWTNIGSSAAVPNGVDERLTDATSFVK